LGEEVTLKVALVNHHRSDFLGGSEIQCDLIASGLTRFGHEVVYLAVNGRDSGDDTPYRTTPVESFGLLKMWRILREIRPDVVYWRHNKKGLFVSALAAKLLGIKFAYSMSHVCDSRIWENSGTRPFETFRGALRNAKSPKGVLKSLPALTEPLYSAVNYLAIPFFVDGVVCQVRDMLGKLPVRKQTAIRNSMASAGVEFSWHRPFVLWVANIKPKKNPEKFQELARTLAHLDVDFLMIGAIQDKRYQYLTQLEEGGNFHYLGARHPSEVNGVLASSLFLVHTCNPEGFPNNLIQAWLQGKPTISLYYDPESTIESNGMGFLSRDFETLVSQSRRLIEDPDLRGEMGRRARAYSEENFNTEKNVRKLEQFLLQLTSQRRNP
jgi:glycosyltransferase involved in cell wall biosynthesis